MVWQIMMKTVFILDSTLLRPFQGEYFFLFGFEQLTQAPDILFGEKFHFYHFAYPAFVGQALGRL